MIAPQTVQAATAMSAAANPAPSIATMRQTIAQSFRRLGLPTPEFDARLLVAHALALDHAGLIAQSARLQVAFEALDKVAEQKEKALIFLDDLGLQARLAGLMQRRYGLRAPPPLINGSVDGSQRQARVDAFQMSAEGFDAMILSPRAGGVGLTLTRANHVIHLSRWWNPAVEDQCTGRVHRIGATKPIFIHLPMAVLGNGQSAFDGKRPAAAIPQRG